MIEVQDLTKEFLSGRVKAVNRASFKLEKGQVGCIIGMSGCGKTTTLKMINRLIEPTSGNVSVNGQNARTGNAVVWRRKIGYVIQKAGLLPHLTVRQNISLLSKILKREKSFITERVRELMDIINMPYEKFGGRYPVELSGGQQQRVGIARALMEDPPVLLMDEPFGALDPMTSASLHEEFIHLNQKLNKTILMVTHDMDEAFKLGDRIILMDKGNIVQVGSRDDLVNNPKDEFVANFIEGKVRE